MLRAIIFDFDGVIADDESLHLQAFQDAFARRGILLDRDVYYDRYLGFDDRGCVRQLLADQGRPTSGQIVEEVVADKQRSFMATIVDGVRLFPGVAELVRGAALSYPLAIASGAFRAEIETILTAAGLRDSFVSIASADDIAVGKPDPAIFHLALARLNAAHRESQILPRECVVVEDSVAGVEGAKRANMRCVAVTNSYESAALRAADLVVSSLEGLTLRELQRLCNAR